MKEVISPKIYPVRNQRSVLVESLYLTALNLEN